MVHRVSSTCDGTHRGQACPCVVIACAECHLLVEADHRIANHLALLASYVRLKAADLAAREEPPDRAVFLRLLEGVELQIDAVGRLHRALASGGQDGSVHLGEHLHAVCAPFASGLSEAITLTEDFAQTCVIGLDQVLPLTQIVAEAITNAFKHAQPHGRAGTVCVRCRPTETGAARVEIIDDGPGLPARFDPVSEGGLGLRLMQALARQLKASLVFESSDLGLCVQLTLPAPMSARQPRSDEVGA